MPRKTLGLCFASTVVMVFAALVAAQETTRRPQNNSVVKPPVYKNNSAVDSSGRRSTLVDRLREIRRGSGTPTPIEAEPESPAVPVETEHEIATPPNSVLRSSSDNSSGAGSVLRRPGTTSTPSHVAPTPAAPPAAPSASALRSSSPGAESEDRSSRRVERMMVAPQPRFGQRTVSDRTVLMSSEGPALRVEATGPQSVVIGKEATYMIRLVNTGEIGAREIYVRLALPQSVQIVAAETTGGAAQRQDDNSGQNRILWTVDQLASRAQEQLTLRVTPQENKQFDLSLDWAVRPATVFAQIDVQQPLLQMSLSGPKEILFGETQTYTISLTNPGTGDAENVVVDLAPGQIGSEPRQIGTIPAGQQKQIEVELTARQAGAVEIRAVASGEGGLQAEIAERIVVRRATLHVDVDGPGLKFAGTAGEYRVKISNTGDARAQNVIAAFVVPSGMKYLGGIDGGNFVGRALNWSVGTLEAGGEREFVVQCEMVGAGESRIEARAQAEGDLAANDVMSTQIEAIADLKLTVNDPQGPQAVGRPVTYEVHIVNRGTKTAEQITVLAQFSDGIEPTKAEGWRAEVVPGQVLFQPISRLDPGQQITLKVTAVAEREGSHRFRAEVKCNEPDTRLVSEDTTRFFGESRAVKQR